MQHPVQRPDLSQPDCFTLCLSFYESVYVDNVPAVEIFIGHPATSQPDVDNPPDCFFAIRINADCFWCGVIVGAGVEFAVLVVVAMCYGKKNRR